MSYLDFDGGVGDHLDNFEDTDWLRVHHEATQQARLDFARSLAISPGSRILDVACGAGGWSHTFSSTVVDSLSIGFDKYVPSNVMSKESSQVHYLMADVKCLPFRQAVFDLVFVANSVHYPVVGRSLANLIRLLKPKGRLVLRSFDEGLTLIHPCDVELQSKVIWAAAKSCKTSNQEDAVDPFAGRKLKLLVDELDVELVVFTSTPTMLAWPFTSVQWEYILGNIRWLGETARPHLSPSEYSSWMLLGQSPEVFRDNPDAYYTVFEFMVEAVKPV